MPGTAGVDHTGVMPELVHPSQLDPRLADLQRPHHTGFTGGLKDQVTVRQLLTHRSGLPAGRDLWRIARTPDQARQAVIDTKLNYKPGVHYEYSDLGADMLGFVVEAISGQRLDAFLEKRMFGPLGMQNTEFRPADSVRYRSAPTEVAPPRGYPIRGEVHDENAWVLDGVSGHAGLFATAADLLTYGRAWLRRDAPFASPTWLGEAVRDRSNGEGAPRGLLWRLTEPDWSYGQGASARAYAHSGFTGTSLAIDPVQGWICVLLTNRVHPDRAAGQEGIAALRRAVHTAVVTAYAEGSTGSGA